MNEEENYCVDLAFVKVALGLEGVHTTKYSTCN